MTGINKIPVRLLAWYRKNARDLPWRKTKDPYKIWISEIMLQQTTVNAVIPYYKEWIKAFPTIRHVAQAREQIILKFWQGLGYYQRARNILKSAKLIVRDFNAEIPGAADELKRLPGFGPYTTGAVLSIAFNRRHPIIDANVRRVIMRLLAIQSSADVKVDKRIYDFLERIMPRKSIGDFNQALMEIGALVCRQREPTCNICPIREHCQAYSQGVQELIPVTRKKVIKELRVSVGVLKKGNKYLIQKRPEKGLLAGLWEFPGGKIEKGESPETALKREFLEELGVEISDVKPFTKVRHFYTQFKVNLHVFSCITHQSPRNGTTYRLIELKDFIRYPMPSGSAKIVERLRLLFRR